MFVQYKNGNYKVLLNLTDGTKIRFNDEDSFIPSRPESMDVKITNRCEHGCLFCHENSIINGAEASLTTLQHFAEVLPPYTEIACGGGNLMLNISHTEQFLTFLKAAKAIPSITIRQDDFIKFKDKLKEWSDKKLVYGIGVSVYDPINISLHDTLSLFPNAVIHTIAGLYNETYFRFLYDFNYKILILGFKQFRRGNKYYNAKKSDIEYNLTWLTDNIEDISKHFQVVSFDNLAIEQLKMKDKISQEKWDTFYCGDDGSHTFYVDLVEEVFAKNSTSISRFPIANKTAIEMFKEIRRLYA